MSLNKEKIHKFNQDTLLIDKEISESFDKQINLFILPKEIEENKIVAAQWHTSLGPNVCPLCRSLHGQVFPVDSPEFGRLDPPIHLKCECILSYITGRERGVEERIKEYQPVDPELLKKWTSKLYTKEEIKEMAKNISIHTILDDRLKEFADKYKDYKTERVLILDTNGKPITFISGTDHSFTLSGKDIISLKDRNLIMIHNHPNGAAFSPADIAVANRIKCKEIHVVGTKYHYIIYPKELGNWPRSRLLLDLRFRSETENIAKLYKQDIRLGMTRQDTWIKYVHKIWQTISKEFDLIYKRMPI